MCPLLCFIILFLASLDFHFEELLQFFKCLFYICGYDYVVSLSLFMRCIRFIDLWYFDRSAVLYSMAMMIFPFQTQLLRNWWPADRILKADRKMSTLVSQID